MVGNKHIFPGSVMRRFIDVLVPYTNESIPYITPNLANLVNKIASGYFAK
jgi:hypothetical protein